MDHRDISPNPTGDHYNDNKRPIPFDYEIVHVDGQRGRNLAIEQANAILEVWEWFGRQTPPPTP
jgi:hypothetical protein